MGLFGTNYRKEFDKLSAKYSQLQAEKAKLTEQNQSMLSVQQLKPFELSELIEEKENEVWKINQLIEKKKANLDIVKKQIESKEKELSEINDQLVVKSDQVMYESFGLYKPRYAFSNSSSFKAKLTQTRN